METSAKPKSQPGTSGQKDKNPETELENPSSSEKLALPPTIQTRAEVVKPVAESVKPRPALSESDRKLAEKMSQAIAKNLGLSGKSRSVRI
jgi:hypothetical protein